MANRNQNRNQAKKGEAAKAMDRSSSRSPRAVGKGESPPTPSTTAAASAPAVAAAPAAPAAPEQDDQIAKLQELAQLNKQGILSDEEFAAAKAKVLGI